MSRGTASSYDFLGASEGARVAVMARQGPFDPRALRDARLAAGLTQHELARLLGVAGGERVSRWELGLSAPRTATLMRAAEVLRVDAVQLVGVGGLPSLSALRRSRGLTLADLAREVHVSKSTLSRWESGQVATAPSNATVDQLASALGVASTVVRQALHQGGKG